ncbi:MAG: hypothetical protein KAG37_02020, partial [Flavobacteriales bacterium]|nr:hypothetical protein [Flavobacteriales bacterium]
MKYSLLVLFAVFFSCSSSEYTNKAEFKFDFKNTSLGELSSEELEKETDSLKWNLLSENADIVEDSERGKVMRVKYPKGKVGPGTIGFSGAQFLKELTPANDYYLDYYVKFDKGFD